MSTPSVEIKQYEFNNSIFEDFKTNHYAKDLWPLVYILSDGETNVAYVGETTDAYSRMSSHLKNSSKSKLTSVHLITSQKFNKSATLDIESNLIKYISGDGVFKLLNGNIGLANHNYYQKKEVYWDIFNSVWDSLRSQGITKHSLEHIDNSDLFKYSPYKSLTNEQTIGLLEILNCLNDDNINNTVVEGGAGTGKTILAIFLFKILSSNLEDFSFKEFGEEEKPFIELVNNIKTKLPEPKMALVVPMASFRTTLKKVFRNIKGLSANMVIGPAEVSKNYYDILVVDESHRLRRRINLGAYYGAFDKACIALDFDKTDCSELDWITKQSDKAILFYDENQSIKPSDTKKEDFDRLKELETTTVKKLKSQFRVKGGNAYVEFIDKLLNCDLNNSDKNFDSKHYEFLLFDSLEEMVNQIKLRNDENGLSRLIAGYSWKWISNKDKEAFDIIIDDVSLKWNGTANDWINSEGSINEVGCIHTTQGYDLNYSGIIFGNEISYDKENHKILIREDNYFDKNGKQSIKDPEELKAFIINIYKTIMLRGIKGTYVYVCDESLREYFNSFIPKIENDKKEIEYLDINTVKPFVNSLPLYDLKVAAGSFSEIQNIEDYKWIKPSKGIKLSEDLFVCQVVGESMNKIIPNGAHCIFRKYSAGTRSGKIVLVEHTNYLDSDFGSHYTVKEYESSKYEDENGWSHQRIILKPKSTDESYKELVLEDDELSSFKVIGTFESVLQN